MTGENCETWSLDIIANQTNKQVAMAFTMANLKAIIIVVSQNMTMETNDGTTPDDTFALKASKPFVWDSESGVPNPFTANVDEIYLTNTTAGTFKAFVFKGDVTP